MARLPAVLDERDLPLPELIAAGLDGEVVRIDRGWVSIDEPDLRELRAAVLGKRDVRDLIVERRSAAWVHGALLAPPTPPQFCVPITARIAMRVARDFPIREIAIEEDDVIAFGEVRCTTLARTVYDLARDRSESDADAIDATAAALACAGSIRATTSLAELVRTRVESAFRLPHKACALDRLDRAAAVAAAQPAETRYTS
ncbi:hypothetical protein ACDF64_15440 [Agromyces sp. MMS24-JH15]|uniref:hypothetical protein n=1 Tax=Agromyces sp. MMS24-JH15 TaxID=3243765 RepID=UPI0037486D5C